MRSASVAFVYPVVDPVLKIIAPLLLTEFAITNSLFSCKIADSSLPPSCLKTILGLSPSVPSSSSASRIKTQSPDVPEETCNVPAGT